MKSFKKNWPTLLTAFILSVVTLGVFASSKDQGPESTVRRYHEAILKQSEEEMKKLIEMPDSQGTNELNINIQELLNRSRTVELGRTYTRGRESHVDVYYHLASSNTVVAVRYVVVKTRHRWKVDSNQTLSLRKRMRDFS